MPHWQSLGLVDVASLSFTGSDRVSLPQARHASPACFFLELPPSSSSSSSRPRASPPRLLPGLICFRTELNRVPLKQHFSSPSETFLRSPATSSSPTKVLSSSIDKQQPPRSRHACPSSSSTEINLSSTCLSSSSSAASSISTCLLLDNNTDCILENFDLHLESIFPRLEHPSPRAFTREAVKLFYFSYK